MGQACQQQCLSVVTMETDALAANSGCLRDVFSAVALPICPRFLIFPEEKSCMVRVQGLILSDIIRVPRGLNFTSKESFSVSLKTHSLFGERKTLCHLSNMRHSRWQPFSQALYCLIFLSEPVFSHTASCEKDVEQFYRPHQVRVIHSANLLTSSEHFYYSHYPWDRLKYHGTSCQRKQIKSRESQIFQGAYINIFRKHSCRFCFISSKTPLSPFLWHLHPSYGINSAVPRS